MPLQPFSAGPAVPTPHRMVITQNVCSPTGLRDPEILGARPRSARRGCTSISYFHSFLVEGKQRPPGMGFSKLHRVFTAVFFSLLSKISTTKQPPPCKYDRVFDEPIPCKLRLRGIQVVSRASPWGLSSNRLKGALTGATTLSSGQPHLHLISGLMCQGSRPITWSAHYFLLNCSNLVPWTPSSLFTGEKVGFREASAVLRVTQPVPAELEFKLGLPDSEACFFATCHFLRLIHEDLHSKPTGKPEEDESFWQQSVTSNRHSSLWTPGPGGPPCSIWAWLTAPTGLLQLLDCCPLTWG